MLIKGIIFLFVFVLFVERLINRYRKFTETGQVDLLGTTWEGNIGLLVLLCIAALAVTLLVLGIRNIRDYFSASRGQE